MYGTILRRPKVSIFATVMALIIATMALWTSAAAQSTPIPADALRTITVSGTGIVSTTPDTASVTLGIQVTNESLKTAQDDVSRRLTGVTDTLTKAGIAKEDIKTSSYNVNPVSEYDRAGNYKGISQYKVSVAMTVTVRDLDALGTILDATVSAGVNDVWGISMYVDDTSEAASQARTAAMTDARARADEFARAEGLLITGVYSITETSAPSPKSESMNAPMDFSAGEARSAEAMPVPISAGSTDIRVDVQVIYTVEQGNG